MLPPITNFAIVLLKDTAVIYAIAVPEIMAYARNLVTAHGGTIRAESAPGSGTTITFTLPVD